MDETAQVLLMVRQAQAVRPFPITVRHLRLKADARYPPRAGRGGEQGVEWERRAGMRLLNHADGSVDARSTHSLDVHIVNRAFVAVSGTSASAPCPRLIRLTGWMMPTQKKNETDAFVSPSDPLGEGIARLQQRRTPLFKEFVLHLAESGQLGAAAGTGKSGFPRMTAQAGGCDSCDCGAHNVLGRRFFFFSDATTLDRATLAYSLATPLRVAALPAFVSGWLAYLKLVDVFDQLEPAMRACADVRRREKWHRLRGREAYEGGRGAGGRGGGSGALAKARGHRPNAVDDPGHHQRRHGPAGALRFLVGQHPAVAADADERR